MTKLKVKMAWTLTEGTRFEESMTVCEEIIQSLSGIGLGEEYLELRCSL